MTPTGLVIALGLLAVGCLVVFVIAAIRLERKSREYDEYREDYIKRYGGR